MADDPNAVDSEGGGDVVITDRELYDHAISDTKPEPAAPAASPDQLRGPAAPSPQPEPQPAPQAQSPDQVRGERQRDEHGRFVPKGAQGAQPQQPQPPDQVRGAQQPQRQPEDHRVPLRELLDERERRQRIEAEAAQMRQAWAEMQRQQQATQAPQTIFDDPDGYLARRVMDPLRQEAEVYVMKVKDGLSREMANQQFGAQAVDAALTEMTRQRPTPQGDFAFRQIMASGHPYGELVKWHVQQRAQQAIGSDPNAWLRQQQEQWINDPRVQAEAVRRMQQRQQQQQPQANRPPNVQLPPSLSSMPASSGRIEEQGDLSDASLYRYAIK